MTNSPADIFHIVVETLAAVPGSGERLVVEHRNDGSGRCRVCTIGAQAGNQQWPCWLYNAGTEARRRELDSAFKRAHGS